MTTWKFWKFTKVALRLKICKSVDFSHNREFFSKFKKVVTSTWKSNFRPDDKSSHAPTSRKFFVFSSKSNYFLSERSSPLGLVKFYFGILGQSPPKFSILLFFPWIANSILICCTKVFDLLHCWSICLCCPDQNRPFSLVKEVLCTFIGEKSLFFVC